MPAFLLSGGLLLYPPYLHRCLREHSGYYVFCLTSLPSSLPRETLALVQKILSSILEMIRVILLITLPPTLLQVLHLVCHLTLSFNCRLILFLSPLHSRCPYSNLQHMEMGCQVDDGHDHWCLPQVIFIESHPMWS